MTSVFALDANCIVAAASDWHRHHAAATTEINSRLARGERMSVSLQALTEAYSVLTRLPGSHKVSPSEAWTILNDSFIEDCMIVTLDSAGHVRWLAEQAKQGTTGGRVYDALIAECARMAGAKCLLTFNVRHFDPPPDGVAIVEPTA